VNTLRSIGQDLHMELLAPMLAVLGTMPPPNQQAYWSFEMKWDGVRTLAYLERGQLTLYARSGRDRTALYPELEPMAEAVPAREAIIDGEVVAFGEDGRPSFAALQTRMHSLGPAPRAPIAFLAFDLLHLNGISLLGHPYVERRGLLDSLELAGPNWQIPPVFRGMGDAALQTSHAQNLEGVVAKRLDSLYEPGRRSQAWIKVKNTMMQSVVVGGWRTGKDSRQPTFGSLLCGINDPSGRLVYVGRVGSGFNSETLGELTHRLTSLARTTSPFHDTVPYEDTRDAHWVDPVLVGEVVFAGWTPDNRLWHPRWRGLRDDISPEAVIRES
jgi:bifunctional non-homologous end joining protein LigD